MTFYRGRGAEGNETTELLMRCLIALISRLGDEASLTTDEIDSTSYTVLHTRWDERRVTLTLRPATRDELDSVGE